MIKVAIVDDHSVVRIGIKYVLKTEPRLAFVGEAAAGEEARARRRCRSWSGQSPTSFCWMCACPGWTVSPS